MTIEMSPTAAVPTMTDVNEDSNDHNSPIAEDARPSDTLLRCHLVLMHLKEDISNGEADIDRDSAIGGLGSYT
jgi:hypothetical protein